MIDLESGIFGVLMNKFMSERLLISDMDSLFVQNFRRFMLRRGYEVFTAENSADCLSKLCKLLPDVLVLGLDIAERDSDRLLQAIRQDDLLSTIPVILVATEKSPGITPGDLEPPVMDYFQRPCRMANLLESIQAILSDRDRAASLLA